MIELNEYTVSRGDCFRIAFWQTLKKCYWIFVYASTIFTAIGIIEDDWIFPLVGILGILIIIPITCYIAVWKVMPSTKDTHYYQKRKLSFDTDKFHVQLEDGSESHILLNHIIRANRFGNYYLLFLDKVQSYPVPILAFRSEEDRMRFETEILGDKLKAGSIPWKRIIVFLLVSACLFGSAYTLRQYAVPVEEEREYFENGSE